MYVQVLLKSERPFTIALTMRVFHYTTYVETPISLYYLRTEPMSIHYSHTESPFHYVTYTQGPFPYVYTT